MNLFAIRKHVDAILHPLISRIGKLPIRANQWTFIGVLVGISCGAALLYGYWWLGLVLMLVRGLIDHIDGYVARNFNQRSTYGAIMDDVADRWVLGIMYGGACLRLAAAYPHVLIVMGVGITGALTNVIVKLSIYAETQQDIFRKDGKIGHPVDVVGMFGSAEFLIYFGVGVLLTAILHDLRPLLAGCWAVAVMSHVSLFQRIWFAWKRYRFVDPGAAQSESLRNSLPNSDDERPGVDGDDETTEHEPHARSFRTTI